MITFLNVPYAEKDKAKSLGARWNPARKQWYIVDVEDITEFIGWIPGAKKSKPANPKKKDRPMMIAGKKTGTDLVIIDCNCCPPWEVCEHSFPWAIEAEQALIREAQQRI